MTRVTVVDTKSTVGGNVLEETRPKPKTSKSGLKLYPVYFGGKLRYVTVPED